MARGDGDTDRAARGGDGASTSGSADQSYIAVLRRNPQFALAFLGEAVSQAGNWFAYMAARATKPETSKTRLLFLTPAVLILVQRLAPGSSQAISGVVISRYLPATLLAPALGNVADSRDKRLGIVLCSVVAGGCSALLCAVRHPALLPIVYILLVMQAAAVTQYDLFRRSLIPLLVPTSDLQLSNTLDGLLWSLMLAVGASLGGFCVASVGVDASLVIDACSFVVSAAIFFQLAPSGASAAAAAAAGRAARCRQRGASAVELTSTIGGVQGAAASADADSSPFGEIGTFLPPSPPPPPPAAAAAAEDAPDLQSRGLTRELSCCTVIEKESVASSSDRSSLYDGYSSDDDGYGADGKRTHNRNRSGWEMFVELVSYLRRRPHVAVLCLLKASGSSVWCAADILQVHFASLPRMQLVGGQAATMGLFFASVGAGCVLGPLAANKWLGEGLWPCVVGSGVVSASYALLTVAAGTKAGALGFLLVVTATMFRSCGSSVLWIWSTTLIQVLGEIDMLGRLFSLEQSAQSAACAASTYLAGVAADRGAADTAECLVLLAAGLTISGLLVVYFRWFQARGGAEGEGERAKRGESRGTALLRGGGGGGTRRTSAAASGARGVIGDGSSDDEEEGDHECVTLIGGGAGCGGGGGRRGGQQD